MTVDRADCIEWTRARLKTGYGIVNLGGTCTTAHRMVWTQMFGDIPADQVVRHRCDNPPCVNPEHLELGTEKQNMQDCIARGRNHQASRTECKNGHPFPTLATSGPRRCVPCKLAYQRNWYARNGRKKLS